ncbi:MAG: hypothetical protein ABIP64_15090 [Burkholderiales bacterium]
MAANGSNNFGIRDNHSHGKVADFLVEKTAAGSQLSVVSAYFTIYAYEALSAELDRIGQLHFLVGEPRFIASLDPTRPTRYPSRSRMRAWNWPIACSNRMWLVVALSGYATR